MNEHDKEEERFVDFLKNTAQQAYNPPPETPRDEMWAVIQAERAAQRDEDKVVSIHRSHSRLWWVGVAAALVIGVGLGRVSLWSPAETGEQVVAVQQPVGDSQTPVSQPPEGDAADAANPDAPGAEDSAATTAGTTPVLPTEAPSADEPAADAPTVLSGDAPTLASNDSPAPERTRSTLPYRVAAADLLTRSETFLTMFKTDGADDELNAQFAAWARTLLMQTRLMIDSPAGEDAQMRSLLEDLELALVQIVQLGGQSDGDEAKRIGEGLDDGQLLFKLRSLPDPKRGT